MNAAPRGATALSGKILLRAVVGIVFACGSASLLAGLWHAIGRGAFSSQLLAGPIYIALAIWLFRGSNTARIVLAVLFSLGLAFFIGLAWIVPELTTIVLMLVLAAMSLGVLWALIFSKPFRAELAVNAAKYRKANPGDD
jgi:hypothetical protein